MKRSLVVLLATLVPLACGGDDSSDDGATTQGGTSNVTTPGTAGDDDGGSGSETAAPGDDGGDTTTGGADDGGMAGPPTIDSIAWTHAAGCTMNTGSDVTVVVNVTDPDNDPAELTYEGLLIGCTGEVDMQMATLVCPQVAPYTGTVTVTDPDGGSDSLEITIDPCVDGSAP